MKVTHDVWTISFGGTAAAGVMALKKEVAMMTRKEAMMVLMTMTEFHVLYQVVVACLVVNVDICFDIVAIVVLDARVSWSAVAYKCTCGCSLTFCFMFCLQCSCHASHQVLMISVARGSQILCDMEVQICMQANTMYVHEVCRRSEG